MLIIEDLVPLRIVIEETELMYKLVAKKEYYTRAARYFHASLLMMIRLNLNFQLQF